MAEVNSGSAAIVYALVADVGYLAQLILRLRPHSTVFPSLP
jgi:hypothetical protein